MPLAQTVATALGAALIVLAAAADIPPAQSGADSALPPAARRDATTIPEKIRPEGIRPGGSGSSTEPLSNQLNRSGGIIRPPEGVDAGISQNPPKIGPRSTPVIPPPGSGSDNEINPK